jgi:uncharacterized membrane protein
MSIGLLKTLHVLGVILFVGNIVVTAFWKVMADRTRDVAVMRFAVRVTNWADVLFTFGGIVLLVIAGQALAQQQGMLPQLPWMRWSYALFAVTGIVWVALLLPLQWAQARLLSGLPREAPIPARYWRLAQAWGLAGSMATILPLGIVYLMTAKPAW